MLDLEACRCCRYFIGTALRHGHIKYLLAPAAQEVRMRPRVAIVMDVAAVDGEHRERVALFKCRPRQRGHLRLQVAVYGIHRGVRAVLHQVAHYRHPLHRRLYAMLFQMLYYKIHISNQENRYKFEIVTKLQQFYFPPKFQAKFFRKKYPFY